jgi:cytochrome b subunit of formate dehydrogenase
MVLSFTTLAVTGLVQKFAFAGISIWLINTLGGIESVRVIHRIAAIVLMVESVYHIGLIGYNLIVRRYRADLLLGVRDIKVALQSFAYNMGWRQERPQQGRYTFEEKFEYFAIIWGTLVMIVTGFVLWNPIATTAVLPGEFVPAAKAVHSGEALLAVLAIIVWHSYHVHIRRFNKSMFTGRISEEEMHEEHPLELARFKEETPEQPAPDSGLPQRRRRFLMIYGAIAVILLIGIAIFVTFEQTAIETVTPPEPVTVLAELPARSAPQVVSFDSPMTSWEDGVQQFFQMKCTFCHGTRIPLSGLDLTDYDKALLGGSTVPAIVPNHPDNSGVIQQHLTGDHPALVTPDELERLAAWITAGAPR